MTLSFASALAICVGIYYFATIINTATKGKIGTMFTVSLIFLIGFWTIIPKDIVSTSQLDKVADITNLIVLVHVGTLFKLKNLKQDWRVVVTTLSGILGITIVMLTVGRLIFGKSFSIASIPPLAGGMFATKIMMDAANAKGLVDIAVSVLLINSFQSFLCIPLIGFGVRRYSNELLVDYRKGITNNNINNINNIIISQEATTDAHTTLAQKIPAKYKNPFYYFLCVIILSIIANKIAVYTTAWTGNIINASIISILIGFLCYHFGLLEPEPLTKTGAYQFLMMAMLISMRSSLGSLDFYEMVQNMLWVFGALIFATLGVLLVALPIGKRLGFSTYLSMSFAFCVFGGYPLNYQTAIDAIEAVTETEEERAYLKDAIIPKVIVGGVTAVTIVSVIIAGILSGLI